MNDYIDPIDQIVVCPHCGHDPEIARHNEDYLRSEISILRHKIKIIRAEVIRRWDRIDPKWLMEELDR